MYFGETSRGGGTTFGGGTTLARFATGSAWSSTGLHLLPIAARGSAIANAQMHAARANLICFSSLSSIFNVCH